MVSLRVQDYPSIDGNVSKYKKIYLIQTPFCFLRLTNHYDWVVELVEADSHNASRICKAASCLLKGQGFELWHGHDNRLCISLCKVCIELM